MFSLRPHSNRWLSLSLLEVHPLCRPHVLVVNAFVAPIPPFASGQTGKYSFPAKPRDRGVYLFRKPNFQLSHILAWLIIGPESDHCSPLSLTHWLTHWLTDSLLFSWLYWCDPGVWRCQLKTCWCCNCNCHCNCCWWGLCWQQFFCRFWSWGLVKKN